MMTGVKNIPKDEKLAVSLCRILKRCVKDGTVDDNWDEVGAENYWLEFKGIGKTHIVVNRRKEGRKVYYNMQVVSEQGTDVQLPFTSFDYNHTTGKALVLKFGDSEGNQLLTHTVKF